MNLDYIFKRFSMIAPKVLIFKTKLKVGSYSDRIFILNEILYSQTTFLLTVKNIFLT